MSESVATLHDDRPVKMPLRFLLGCLAVAAAVSAAYFTITRDVSDAHKRIEILETRANLQQDVLYELRSDMRTNREQTALIIKMLEQPSYRSNRE